MIMIIIIMNREMRVGDARGRGDGLRRKRRAKNKVRIGVKMVAALAPSGGRSF